MDVRVMDDARLSASMAYALAKREAAADVGTAAYWHEQLCELDDEKRRRREESRAADRLLSEAFSHGSEVELPGVD